LEFAARETGPVILHMHTTKGKGYEPALAAPEKFHGLGPFEIITGESPKKTIPAPPNYQDVFGQRLLAFAQDDKRIIGITAAMPPGTGLSYLRESLPEQFYDVGIAEEHAVIFAAGMACEGLKPVVAIYSTFLQRAYDPIIHDVCLQNLPVVFCMDRAGLSPNDGPTHHGLFDIAYLRCVPNTVIMQPKDEDELADMLWTALQCQGPVFIRYPRGSGTGAQPKSAPAVLPIGQAEVTRHGTAVQFWALGPWVQDATRLAEQFHAEDDLDVGVVNARFAKPLDTDLLLAQAAKAKLIVTFEDHARMGGFGSAIVECLSEHGCRTPVVRIGYPDRFVEHGSTISDLRAANGLDPESIHLAIRRALQTV
jgi:1-deoxy-D-xylulose-5-phosphate synthase